MENRFLCLVICICCGLVSARSQEKVPLDGNSPKIQQDKNALIDKGTQPKEKGFRLNMILSQISYQSILWHDPDVKDFTAKVIMATSKLYKDKLGIQALELMTAYLPREARKRAEALDSPGRALYMDELAIALRPLIDAEAKEKMRIAALCVNEADLPPIGVNDQSVEMAYKNRIDCGIMMGCQSVIVRVDFSAWTKGSDERVGLIGCVRRLCEHAKQAGQRNPRLCWILIEPINKLGLDLKAAQEIVMELRKPAGDKIDNIGIALNLSAIPDEEGKVWLNLRPIVRTVVIDMYRFEESGNHGKREINRDYSQILKNVARQSPFQGSNDPFKGEVIVRYLGSEHFDCGIEQSQKVISSITSGVVSR
ncbi:unnamed protein product [uncultured bacterium]|nr:unnamed protein product [uncultured bacterium]